MFTGPAYYHQPGYNQHTRIHGLLEQGIGDGVLVAVDSVKENHLERWITKYNALGKPVLLDVVQYDPNTLVSSANPQDTELLLDSGVRYSYVHKALQLQHDLNCSSYIVPHFETRSVSDGWYRVTRSLCATTREWIEAHGDPTRQVLLTIAVPSSDIANDERRREIIGTLSYLRNFVNGFYLNITEIPQALNDAELLKGLMYSVFKLKWQGFKVMLSKTGAWVVTMFPLGLDIFGNGGFLSQQQVKTHRFERRSGGQRPNYVKVWSPASLSYVRYPDDAQQLYSALQRSQIEHILGKDSGFAPPADRSPDEVYSVKGYQESIRLNHFSATMAALATRYQNKGLHDRIEMVMEQLEEARRLDQQIGRVLMSPNRGAEKALWLTTFERFVEENRDHLEDLYS